jgi:hypothetical protein
MIRGTGLWKTILFAAVAAVLTHGAPASALITIESGTSATFAWDPASGNVAGYDVFVDHAGKPTTLYSTVLGRNWETVTAAANETITVYVVAFNASRERGAPSLASEPVVFASGEVAVAPTPGEVVVAPTPGVYGQAADFDSDGVSDMIVQSSRRGYLEVTSMSSGNSTLLVKCRQRSNGTSRCKTVRKKGRSWMIVGNGDYDGDGVTDILFRRHRNGVQRSGPVEVFFMNGDRVREIVKLSTEECIQRRNGSTRCRLRRARVRGEWQIVGSGDYNADGRSDVLFHNAFENKFDLWTMMAGGIYKSEILPDDFGNAAEVIASGDFDGDGMSDILWRDLQNGDVDIWGLTADSTLGPLEGGGNPWWSAIGAGDFDGDGRDDVLLRHVNTDRLALRLSTTGTRAVIQSALNQGTRERQVPSIGDYDGDGLTDLVLYDGGAEETQLWLMEGSVVTASKLLPSPLDSWNFATADLRPPGSR